MIHSISFQFVLLVTTTILVTWREKTETAVTRGRNYHLLVELSLSRDDSPPAYVEEVARVTNKVKFRKIPLTL